MANESGSSLPISADEAQLGKSAQATAGQAGSGQSGSSSRPSSTAQSSTAHSGTGQASGGRSSAGQPSGAQSQAAQARGQPSGNGEGAEQQGGNAQSQVMQRQGEGVVPWSISPFSMINRMMSDMERFFDEVGFGSNRFFGSMRPAQMPAIRALGAPWTPQIEVSERDGKLVVCADLPGMRKEDVRVNLSDDALTIEGERREQRETRGYSERSYGSFYRTIPLPEGVNGEGAQARFEDGVLEITLPMPKREQHRRQLEVK